jgi:eukaryotic-like serine/threonine-protein kinase
MADPLVGHVLEGRYRITQRLARGGMSTVYAAVDERLDRHVAVKVMASSLSADPVFVDRFAREARVAAKLSHVNAVSVYDQGTDAGNVFLVMELVRGRTLRDLLDERNHLSPAEAVSIMEPVLAALAAAHRAGLVHRDVKPENILLADDGLVKVADFGLARAVAADDSSTRTGLMMGTVAYSSPEQFRRGETSARSDVYSAGIVFFELLTGRAPFRGDAMSVAYQHVHNDVPAPSTLRRGLSAPIDGFVARATARDPAGRPGDAGALLAELHDLRRELRLPVLPVPRRPRPGTPKPEPSGPALHASAPARSNDRTDAFSTGRSGSVHHTAVARAEPPGRTAPERPMPPRPAGATTPGRRRGLRTLVGVAVLLLVCGAAGYGGWWLASGRYRSIPDVRNRPAGEATAMLRAAGFAVATGSTAYDNNIVKGAVIRTDPGSGRRLPKGGTVRLVISGGPHLYALPDVTGKTKAQAVTALTTLVRAGVVVSYPSIADDSTAKGEVVRTDPEPGTAVRSGSAVSVFVSTGPPLIVVPDTRGKTQAEAVSAVTALGFSVSTSDAFSDTVPAGRVIRQSPPGGSKLAKFKTVTLVLSKGPDLVEVPALARLEPVDQARAALIALGFKVAIHKSFGGQSGLVVGTNPPSGARIKRGSTVTLYVI